MDKVEQFFQVLAREMAVTLATAAERRVSMRVVSPARYQDAILIFTARDSLKYRQLQANPRCCIAAGFFFAEATAAFLGPTMRDENRALREAYSAKFPDAFDKGVSFGGRDAEFILLRPTRLTGWAFASEAPAAGDVPTIPFEIALEAEAL